MDVCSGCGGGANVGGLTDLVEDRLAQAIDFGEVGAHALLHDLGSDVDHVRVAHARRLTMSVICMRLRSSLGLHLDGEDADFRAFHVFCDGARQISEGTGASSSRTKPFQWQPRRSSSTPMAAAIERVFSS